MYFADIYTNIFFSVSPEIFLPNLLGIFSTILMLLHGGGIPKKLQVQIFVVIIIFMMGSTIFANSGADYFLIRLPSFIQITVAIATFCIACNFMSKFSESTLRKIFLFWLVAIVVGCVAEMYTPLRVASDAFRQWAFENRFVYQGIDRDLEIYGAIRPKLFTQEPSHVAKAFVAFGTGWYLLSHARHKALILIALSVLALLMLRSPFVVLAAPLAIVSSSVLRARTGAVGYRVIFLGILSPIVVVLTLGLGAVAFSGRLDSVVSGGDFSFFSRFVGPYLIAIHVMWDYPLWGVGLGAKEFLFPYFSDVYGAFGSSRYLSTIYLGSLGNGFANTLSFFGLLGGGAFYYLIWRLMSSLDRSCGAMGLMVAIVFFNLDGAVEGVRMWGYIAMIVGPMMVMRRQIRSQESRHAPGATWTPRKTTGA